MANNFSNYGSTSSSASPPDQVSDDEQRFLRLCQSVSDSIFTINAGSTTMERILKQIGTPRDKPELRDSINFTQQKTNGIILTTTQYIRQLVDLARGANKQKRLQVDRLRNEFQELVKRYTTLQKQMADKIRTAYSFQWSSVAPVTPEDESGEKSRLLEDDVGQVSMQKQTLKDIEFEQVMMEERELRIRQIEENMLDVNTIFRELGSMVHEQGEVIDTIVGNIDRTYHNVETGGAQLGKAAQLQKSYRNKLCCFTLILAVVAIVVVVVLVLTLKN